MYPDESDRLLRLERKVDFLFQRMGLDPNEALIQDDGFAPQASAYGAQAAYGQQTAYEPQLPSSFYDALSRNKLIQAIKIYRQITGADLKDAKNAVEAMARQAH
jgi:ribosomal protein L7/L12